MHNRGEVGLSVEGDWVKKERLEVVFIIGCIILRIIGLNVVVMKVELWSGGYLGLLSLGSKQRIKA